MRDDLESIGMTSSPHVVTLGCRLNLAESDRMEAWARAQHFDHLVIVNTCAVTAEAERQARQTVRRLRRERPDAYIIVTGCAAQLRPHIFSAMPEVNRVLGNGAKAVAENFSPHQPMAPAIDMGPPPVVPEAPLSMPHLRGRAKAFLEVQNGCNHFCTFCTIALARGRSRSVPLASICEQAKQFLHQGIQEIILTGVDLTAYDAEGLTLGGMVRRLLQKLPSLQRLRLSSLDSIEMDEDLRSLILSEKRILPYIHLSLQSGSDAILQAMKRRHRREQTIALCQQLKQGRKEIALGADLIAGFPGETEDDFQETLDLVEACQLTTLHVFPFSKRPGTLASRIKDQVPPTIIAQRAKRLREKGVAAMNQWCSNQVGRILNVLVEQPQKGHADDASPVLLTDPKIPNTVIQARVLDYQDTSLIAQPL